MAAQQPMAGGIASVLGKPPGNPGAQAQPMVPQIGNQPGAMPMGIGSVDARAAEFMNKPQELQKRYGMTQDTFDLMALMKIKKEKEMAARQMQLQMGQQDAAQGQPPQTIKDKLEGEVHELTKNELAEQAGSTLKQQFDTKQANLQRMAQGNLPPSMQGIASAPGAQAAAQPKAMAAGGIVAFAGDDPEVGSQVPDPDTEGMTDDEKREYYQRKRDREAFMGGARKLGAAAMDIGTMPGRAVAGAAESVITRPLRALGVPIPYLPDSFYGGDRSSATPYYDKIRREEAKGAVTPALNGPTAEGVRQHQVGFAGTTPPPDISGVLGGRAGMGATRVGPSGGISSLPDAKNAELRRIQMQEAGIDTKAEREAEEKRVGEKLNTREEEAQRRKYIEEQRSMMKEEFDPERLREQGLIRFLTGAGGRAYGELGAGAQAGMSYDEAQRANKLKRIETIQGKEEGLQALKRKALEDAVGAGQTAYKGASEQKRSGITAATQSEHADIQSRDNALMRDIERLKVQAQREHTAAVKEGNDFAKLQGALNTVVNNRDQAMNRVYKTYKSQLDMVEMQLQAKKDDPTLTHQKQLLEAEIEAKIDAVRKPYDTLETQINTHLYGGKGGTGAISGAKVTRIDKPAK